MGDDLPGLSSVERNRDTHPMLLSLFVGGELCLPSGWDIVEHLFWRAEVIRPSANLHY
jgi:hypothetical protein